MQSKSLQILCDDAAVEALCQSCGACCATFRVSFYWTETTAHEAGYVPVEMTEQMNWYQSCMKGSSASKPRCCALKGEIGQSVSCSIYENRSSTCRQYEVFDAHGQLNPRCNPARLKHGLEPLHVQFIPAHIQAEPQPQPLHNP
ncbi:MAG: YkgJ family cysteine cluster protein [Limnobacter sp.]|nr:YkgJ family cysteine cluster protein [Limnobacter sp.]